VFVRRQSAGRGVRLRAAAPRAAEGRRLPGHTGREEPTRRGDVGCAGAPHARYDRAVGAGDSRQGRRAAAGR
jgi:hypothetical protein